MSNEVYAFAIKSALDEIQNTCPNVTGNFVFKDGKTLAKSENTKEEDATQTIEAFDAITQKADPVGDIESITIRSSEGKIDIANMNDLYLTTVSLKEADEKHVNTLTRVLIPIVIKLAKEIQPASTNNETITLNQPEPEENEASEETIEYTEDTDDKPEDKIEEPTDEAEEYENDYQPEPEEETATTEPEIEEEMEQNEPEPESEITYEMLPEPPVTQLIVENLGGLLVPSDTVRVDQEVIKQWNELYGVNKINEVQVEALNGRTTRCKFKQIKKSKDSGKGIIKMPEKIQLTLETTSGELVTVKPVIE